MIINPVTLLSLRKKKRLSLAELADKSGVDRGTIHRIEKGRRTRCRQVTIERLADALQVDPDALTRIGVEQDEVPEASQKSQLNVRVTNEARNALALVSSRYRVKQSSIIHLAPFLFMWAAEESLKERQRKLDSINQVTDQFRLINQPKHLDGNLMVNSFGEQIAESERRSIAARDIFGLNIPDEHVHPNYEESEHNPMARFLGRLAEGLDRLVSFDQWSPNWVEPGYTLSRELALDLVGGDEQAARYVVDGFVGLHEMPKEVREGWPAEIARWVREKGDAWLKEFWGDHVDSMLEGLDLEDPEGRP